MTCEGKNVKPFLVGLLVSLVVIISCHFAVRWLVPLGPDGHTHESFMAEWEKTGDLEPGRMGAEAVNGLPDPRLYPPVPLTKIAGHDLWFRPRCRIEGVVTLVKTEDDGDRHFVVEGDGAKVVCEIIPELPIDSPKKGQIVVVWGVPRWDGQHKWGEVHPVTGWRVK